MEVWEVTGVEAIDDARASMPFWVIVYHVPESVMPGGHLDCFVPKEAVDNRAVEYGLTDLDQVLRIIIWEPVLRHYQQRAGLAPPTPALSDAAAARAAFDAQVAAVTDTYATVTVAGASRTAGAGRTGARRTADALQPIRDATVLDPILLAARRLDFDRQRLARREGR
ncbi:hypothetical protein [Bailinhaonella thermotolerans]|uniref:Uncharacterized protein n=1 Tax=Bailinhaonella thermotolerans TaxID=1070861 RepID=A0A3A4A066_9ACTN|nr:hypothetical protein [Bailinhaonella thermotolerans]RJL21118.1 hypothetical protein D5H75_38575 [Bailinhaonella thermotolerans]